jgi:hypothetical protein
MLRRKEDLFVKGVYLPASNSYFQGLPFSDTGSVQSKESAGCPV